MKTIHKINILIFHANDNNNNSNGDENHKIIRYESQKSLIDLSSLFCVMKKAHHVRFT